MLRRFLCAILLLPLVALSAPAADAAPAVPGLLCQVAVRSPQEFIDNLDTTVSTITADTSKAVPPSFIPMLVMMQVPLPEVILGSDVPWHFFLVGNDLIVVVAEPYADFRATLEEQGVEFTESEDGGTPTARIPGGGPTFFGDGGQYTVVAGSTRSVNTFLDHAGDWDPAYRYGGDAYIRGGLPERWIYDIGSVAEILDSLDDLRSLRTGEDREKMLAGLTELGITPTVVDGLFSLAEEYIPALIAELGKADNAMLVLDMSGDRFGLDWRLSFAEPSYFAKAITHIEQVETVDPARMRLPDDAIFAGICVPPDQLVYRYAELCRSMNDTIGEVVFPEFRDRLNALTERALALGIGDYLTSMSLRPDGQVSCVWMETDDPQAMLALQRESMKLITELIAHTVSNPDYQWTIDTAERMAADGTPYVEITINAAGLAEALSSVEGLPPTTLMTLEQLTRFRQFVGVADGMLVTVGGAATEEDYLQAVKTASTLSSPASLPDEATQAVEAVRDDSRMIVLVDVDASLLAYGQQIATMYELQSGDSTLKNHLDDVADQIEPSDTFAAVGYGVVDGMLFMNMSIPLDGVNATWRNGEMFYFTLDAKMQAENDAKAAEDMQDDDESDEDEADDFDDAELDEPAGAA